MSDVIILVGKGEGKEKGDNQKVDGKEEENNVNKERKREKKQ